MDVVAQALETYRLAAKRELIAMTTTKIVILNWNGRRHLERFLPQVVANTPQGVGIVVADNGSDDDSVEFLRANFAGVEILELGGNYGFAEGYNRALAAMEADYFVLLNSDAAPAPGWFGPLLALIESNAAIGAVAPKLLWAEEPERFEYAGASGGFIDALGYPFCRGRILSTVECDRGQYDESRDVFWGTGACLMVRSRVFREMGGFDSRFFAHMEEIDLCWRMQLRGYRICVEPASVVYHLGGGTLQANSPRKTFLNFRNNLMMLYKNLSAASLFWVIAARMILDGVAALGWLATGRSALFKSVWRAHRDFFRFRPGLKADRRRIQEGRSTSPRYIYKGSIVLRYIFGRKYFGKLL